MRAHKDEALFHISQLRFSERYCCTCQLSLIWSGSADSRTSPDSINGTEKWKTSDAGSEYRCTPSTSSFSRSIHLVPYILTSHTHIILISVLSYEKLTIITKKPFILIEYQRISKRENLMKIVLTCAIAHSVISSRQGKASEGLYLPFNPRPHRGDFNNVHPCHFVTPLILFSLFLAA